MKRTFLITLALLLLMIVLLPTGFYLLFLHKIYPNIYIENINLSGKKEEEAQKILSDKINIPDNITLTYGNVNFNVQINQLQIVLDNNNTVKKAMKLGRSGNIISDIKEIIKALTQKIKLPLLVKINDDNLSTILNQISDKINVTPTDAKFTIVNGKVQTFIEEKDGLEVEKEKLTDNLLNTLNTTKTINLEIPTKVVPAKIKTSDINNLGIKEIIGSGISHFAGSDSSRIFNINLAASKLNGTLIPPGQVFSFDQEVGDISQKTGFKQALVIQNDKTVLGDGGGVCQVSTTMFRAAMNSGLPITERVAHAYRVHYYEEDQDPGFDATIYYPTVDLKFKNDTQDYILIQTQIDLTNLVLTFNLYGTKDGRIVNLTKPNLWGYIPPPSPLYTDDPTLPLGQIKQVDWAASGIKSQFEYTVVKDGSIINHQTFYSNYVPWQAKFLKGTKI